LSQDWWFKKLKSMILRDSNASLIMEYRKQEHRIRIPRLSHIKGMTPHLLRY
jgi:hypothetical protein